MSTTKQDAAPTGESHTHVACTADARDAGRASGPGSESHGPTATAAATPSPSGLTACVTNTDLHALLAARREIAVVWCVEDVLEVRPDLSEDSSWAVLQACKSCHDANIGISWDVLRVIADELFPSGGPGE